VARARGSAPPGIEPSSAGGCLRKGIAADFSTIAGCTAGRAMGAGPENDEAAEKSDNMASACRPMRGARRTTSSLSPQEEEGRREAPAVGSRGLSWKQRAGCAAIK
jgi:hypothetical protein